MILQRENQLAEQNATKTDIHFAWFPTRMRRNPDDKDGALVWLERYVDTFKSKRVRTSNGYDTFEWEFSHSERFNKYVLKKFEDQ